MSLRGRTQKTSATGRNVGVKEVYERQGKEVSGCGGPSTSERGRETSEVGYSPRTGKRWRGEDPEERGKDKG